LLGRSTTRMIFVPRAGLDLVGARGIMWGQRIGRF
jgi:hypothetical protein